MGSEAGMDLTLRGRLPADEALVFSDWLHSARDASAYKAIANQSYFHWQHQIIETLWYDPTVLWAFAVSASNPGFVYGWLCAQVAETVAAGGITVLHYCYVKKAFRRFGIAKRLLATVGVADSTAITTHHCAAGRELLKAAGTGELYNPYLLWSRLPTPRFETTAPTTVKAQHERARAARTRTKVPGEVEAPSEEA